MNEKLWEFSRTNPIRTGISQIHLNCDYGSQRAFPNLPFYYFRTESLRILEKRLWIFGSSASLNDSSRRKSLPSHKMRLNTTKLKMTFLPSVYGQNSAPVISSQRVKFVNSDKNYYYYFHSSYLSYEQKDHYTSKLST